MAKKEAKDEIKDEVKLLSISQIAFRFNLDRATVRKRLQKAEIKPDSDKEKEKLYLLTPELEQIVTEFFDDLDATKLRKLDAEADLKEIEVQKRRGELASAAEFTEIVQQIFGTLHKKLAVQLPKRISLRLSKAATQAEISTLLTQEITKEFSNLRQNHKAYLSK